MIQDSQLRAALCELDPRSRVDRFFNPDFYTEEYYVKWETLGFRMGLVKSVSQQMLVEAMIDIEAILVNEIIHEIVESIIEGYIEYWHLYYEGDMSLKEFTGMTDDDLGFYLNSDGEYIGGKVYARARRLQQRDFRRFTGPEHVIGSDS